MGKPLDIGFGIFRLEPFGGLERHALRLAETLKARGHRITVYTTAGASNLPAEITPIRLPPRGMTNHGRLAHFAADLAVASRGRHDTLVGFQKMPGLDFLFCADPCYAARHLGPFLRHLPRATTMRKLEASCFGPVSATRIMLLAEGQRVAYQAAYATPSERITVLSPTVDPRHRIGAPMSHTQHAAARDVLGLPTDRTIWLWVGLQPHVKGLDRAVEALAKTDALLVVCGVAPNATGLSAATRAAAKVGAGDRLRILGRVDDATLANLSVAADLLIHPARTEVTGTVILEALAHGLPVITTAVCGYAPHVTEADAGLVLAEPFDPVALSAALALATSEQRKRWSNNAVAYVARSDLSGGMARAADLIEGGSSKDRLRQ